MGLSWGINSRVAVLMAQALWALEWHISYGDRGFGSGCVSLECCLLCSCCWVVLLPLNEFLGLQSWDEELYVQDGFWGKGVSSWWVRCFL